MKLKVRPSDFKVTERLVEGVLSPRGSHRVYRVQKEKLTSMEAATELASLVGVTPKDIGMAGLKDRQGVTVQFMSVHRGPDVSAQNHDLSIQTAGFSENAIDSEASDGNDFQIVVRGLHDVDTERVRESLEAVRTHGVPNYFDDQRFGNLRHGQGWIVQDLLDGDISEALRRLVASASRYEPPARRSLKEALWRNWGDWAACRSIAGKLGRHHSVFEHLKRDPEDIEGAFNRIATRERLIHLYAFQSHIWNRALALAMETHAQGTFSLRGIEGRLLFPEQEANLPASWNGSLMLPDAQLAGVKDEDQRDLMATVLGDLGLEPGQFVLPDLPGFQLKPELRDAMVVPMGLRVRPAEPDNEFRGKKMLRISFGLPRGAYATMVIRRLVGPTRWDDAPPRFQPTEPHSGEGGGGGFSRRSRRGGRGRGGPRRGGGGGFRGGRPGDDRERREGADDWRPRGGSRRGSGRGSESGFGGGTGGGSRRGGGRGSSRPGSSRRGSSQGGGGSFRGSSRRGSGGFGGPGARDGAESTWDTPSGGAPEGGGFRGGGRRGSRGRGSRRGSRGGGSRGGPRGGGGSRGGGRRGGPRFGG